MPPTEPCEVCGRGQAESVPELEMMLCPRCQVTERTLYEAQTDLRERIEGQIRLWMLTWQASGLELPALLQSLEIVVDDLSQECRRSAQEGEQTSAAVESGEA